MFPKAAIFLCVALVYAALARAQTPTIARIVPAAISPSATTTVAIYGENLRGAVSLWTSFPTEEIALLEDTKGRPAPDKVEFRIRLRADATTTPGAVRLATTNGVSELRLLGFDNFSSTPMNSERTNFTQATHLKLPGAVDGFCRATISEFYKVAARRNEILSVEVIAQRLGSRLDPLVRLLDARGRELIYCADQLGLGGDAKFNFMAPAAGDYFIEIRDVTYRGGEDFFYRLRAQCSAHGPRDLPTHKMPLPIQVGDTLEREPNDSPSSAMKLEIPATVFGRFQQPKDRDYYEFAAAAEDRLVIRGATRSLGSPCDLFLRLSRADGTLVADAEVNGADEGSLTNKFAEAGKYHLLVEDLNRSGGSNLFYRLSFAKLPPGFALSVETNRIEAMAGGSFEIKVNCARRDYDGPIALSLRSADEGLTLLEGQIAEKKNDTILRPAVGSTLRPGKIINFEIVGRADVAGRTVIERASTAPLLKRQFPRIVWPPELDGLVALGIKSAEPSPTKIEQ
ncbi:MAG: PPC domain-containing protein [Verrucomicrobia bacterium]|nr:PPC domain-containing protein [Verrucomicrobiota bacterium]